MRIKIEDDFDNELESEYKSIDDDSIIGNGALSNSNKTIIEVNATKVDESNMDENNINDNFEYTNEEANVSESNYTSALQLIATGSKDKASLKFLVSDNDVIKVVLKSASQTDEGHLVLADSQGQDLTNLTVGVQASEATYTYSGEAGELYLYAKDADLDLFSIQVGATSSDAVSESQLSEATSNSSETTEVDLCQTESADESLIFSSLAASMA